MNMRRSVFTAISSTSRYHMRIGSGAIAHIRILMNRASIAMCELSDGRVYGSIDGSLVVWCMDSMSFELTLTGHTFTVYELIQLLGGRISKPSEDTTIGVWNLKSETNELYSNWLLLGSQVYIAQLLDDRLCTGSRDQSIRVWNMSRWAFEGKYVNRVFEES